MDKVSESPGGAAALPVAVCAGILKLVQQQDRLCQCALVCDTWSKAAIQASAHVEHVLQADNVPTFQHWLYLHASQLRSLNLSVCYGAKQTLQLPLDDLEQLQRLHLQGFKLQLVDEDGSCHSSMCADSYDSSSEDGTYAARSALPQLQHLQLSDVRLFNVDSLVQLTDAPQLRSLIIYKIGFAKVPFSSHDGPRARDAVQMVAAAVTNFLQRMPHLSVLELPGFLFTAVHQAAALHQLQEISITQAARVPACDLRQLPSTITRLQLSDDSPYDTPSLPKDLALLSGLRCLDLRSCAVHPSMLASVPQLQELFLEDCRFLSDTWLNVFDIGGKAAGAVAFLDVLNTLTCLQNLTLYQQTLHTDIIAPRHFSALTASSQLTRLYILQPDEKPLPGPRMAVPHMFPPGRQMQSLKHLTISPGRDASYVRPLRLAADDWCLDEIDLRSVFSACKQLQSLDITSSLNSWDSDRLSVLLQLRPSCTSLQIGGAAFTDAAAPYIAQLTQLEYLEWTWSPKLTDVGLEQLESLHLLRELLVQGSGVSGEITSAGTAGPGAVALRSDPSLGSVSQQLGNMCDLSPPLAFSRLQKHKAAATAKEQQLELEIDILKAEVLQLRS